MNQDNIDLIDSFLNGRLSTDESAEFVNRLNREQDLMAEFKVRELVHEAIELDIESNLRNRLKEQEENPETEKSQKSKKGLILPILLFLFAVIIGILLLRPKPVLDSEKIALQYAFEAHELTETTKGSVEVKAFPTQYVKSVDNFNKGITMFENSNYLAAEKAFNRVIDAEASDSMGKALKEKAEWMSTLCFLAESGTENQIFRNKLSQILKNPAHQCYLNATKLYSETQD